MRAFAAVLGTIRYRPGMSDCPDKCQGRALPSHCWLLSLLLSRTWLLQLYWIHALPLLLGASSSVIK